MTLPHDPYVAAWLAATGAEEGPPESLARALAATRRTRKRPRWTFPERWLPVQLTMTRARSQRPIFAVSMLALLIVALVATALYVGSQVRELPRPFRNGAVVYAAGGDLFIADQLDGTSRPLVAGPEADSGPVFSDQGDRIAFIRRGQRGERITIITVSPDGSDVRELATNFIYWEPTGIDWSPDGSALIVSGGGAKGELAAVVGSDGSGFQPLGLGFQPLDFGPTIFDFRASWRPGGRHIAIEANQEVGTPDNDVYPRGLFLADADGTNVRQLIGPVAHLGGVDWSPDGRQLSFASDGPAGIEQVSIADIDEDGELTALRQLRLDPESSDETRPKWSPDGSQLAVRVSKGDREQIGVVNPDGSGFRIVWPDVTNLGSADEYFWSPDGRSLVITYVNAYEDPETMQFVSDAERTWILDVATGEQTEVQVPVQNWQRLAP